MRLTCAALMLVLSLMLTCSAGSQRITAQSPPDPSAAPTLPLGVALDPTDPANTAPEPVAAGEKIKVKGYINVSSGCQQPTVDLLKKTAREHERLDLELIDFGAEEGFRRWREAGLTCMTITINGHQTVTFGEQGHRRIVTFSYPPGFQWLLPDLEAALKDAVAGKLYYAEEPGATKIRSRIPTLRFTAREGTINGVKVGEVLVNGQVATRLRTTYEDLPPLQRAERAALRLRNALTAGFKPADIRSAKLEDGRMVLAVKQQVICIADEAQARMLKTTPTALAKGWASWLKKALTAAMARGSE